jgi:hypothetical protein
LAAPTLEVDKGDSEGDAAKVPAWESVTEAETVEDVDGEVLGCSKSVADSDTLAENEVVEVVDAVTPAKGHSGQRRHARGVRLRRRGRRGRPVSSAGVGDWEMLLETDTVEVEDAEAPRGSDRVGENDKLGRRSRCWL